MCIAVLFFKTALWVINNVNEQLENFLHMFTGARSPKTTISNPDQYITVPEVKSTLSHLVKYNFSTEFD